MTSQPEKAPSPPILEIAAPYVAWAILVSCHLMQPAAPWASALWFLKGLAGAYLIFLVPGLQLAACLRPSGSKLPWMDALFAGLVINTYFLCIYCTALKLIFGTLSFRPMVIGWFVLTVASTLVPVGRPRAHGAPPRLPAGPARAWAVVLATSILVVLMAPSKAVDEEHWFCDAFVGPDLFRRGPYLDDPGQSGKVKLIPMSGCETLKPGVYRPAEPTMRFEIRNSDQGVMSFPLRLIVHSNTAFPLEMSLARNGSPVNTYWLQERYDITRHSYGYPPANLLVDQVIDAAPGSTELELRVAAAGASPQGPVDVIIYDLSNRTVAETRAVFSKHFVYGDVADNREFVNLARDLRSHLFPYQRFYEDDVGAPGVTHKPEDLRGGPYWNNYPLHPFVESVALVLVEDSMRTFTLMSLLEAVLVFLIAVGAIHMLGWDLGPRGLIPLALVVIAYFSFVRPGIESSSRQAIHDLFLVISLTYLLTFRALPFLASAFLFMLTNASGFGLLAGVLVIQLAIARRRKFNAGCLAAVVGFQLVLTLLLTWLFTHAGQTEYWSKIQTEWWNRYWWMVDLARSYDPRELAAHGMNLVRVAVWALLATFLLPLAQVFQRDRRSLAIWLAFVFYACVIAFMGKPRGHYISSLIAMAAVGGIPAFQDLFGRSRPRQIGWAVAAALGVALCHFHSRLYVYTEDYLPPLFVPTSLLERVFHYF